LKQEWCIPTVGADFVWRMEDVLDLYAEPYKPWLPVVCFDERPCPLRADKRPGLPMKPGQVARYDYEYERNGKCNLFMFFQPLAGWRHTKVTAQRCKADFAECMRELVDVHFPYAQKIRVVLDNLNTHSPSSLYEAFEPAEARRILNKLEFHYTPKHG
jgi:DDE superfamily endonuclease